MFGEVNKGLVERDERDSRIFRNQSRSGGRILEVQLATALQVVLVAAAPDPTALVDLSNQLRDIACLFDTIHFGRLTTEL